MRYERNASTATFGAFAIAFITAWIDDSYTGSIIAGTMVGALSVDHSVNFRLAARRAFVGAAYGTAAGMATSRLIRNRR